MRTQLRCSIVATRLSTIASKYSTNVTMHNNYLCCTNLPKISELLCLFATIHTPEKVNTSYYNLVIKKCRQLIFENSEVLACPNLEELYGVYIIVKDSLYETGKVQKYLADHNLKAGPPTAVRKDIYEDCFMYTIIAKLAPKWNLVSNYFVRGRDFLTNNIFKDCARLSLCINDSGETSMVFEISRIKLPTLTLEKLDLPDNNIKELKEKGVIAFKNCDSKIIRVLPSLKRGKILSINSKINETWVLQNFQQLRRHWKNTYGYRLSEKENNIFYLEISFFDGSPIFTYPSLCVLPYEPTFIQIVDPQSIVAGFISDLMRYMPNILGDKYPIPTHISPRESFLFPGTKQQQQLFNIPDTQNSAIVYLSTQNRENNSQEQKSKLSQLLSQLKRPENKVPIYLTQNTVLSSAVSITPQPQLAKKTNKTFEASKISQDLQSQAKFLSEKLAERSNMASKESQFPKIKSIKNIPESVDQVKTREKQIQDENDLDDFVTPEIKVSAITPIFNNIAAKKRKLDSKTETTVAKKPKEKSVTEVKNMKELVNNGTINKLNVPSLLKWLKERNIHCTTKERKAVLIEKIIDKISKQ